MSNNPDLKRGTLLHETAYRSYLTCTFVILTARRLAVGLGLGRWEYRCPSPVPQSGSAGCNSLFDNLSRFVGVTPSEVEGGARRACPEQRRRAKSRAQRGIISPLKGILCDKSLWLKKLHQNVGQWLYKSFILKSIDNRGGGGGSTRSFSRGRGSTAGLSRAARSSHRACE